MFAIRATLAATMFPTYGVYSGFELFEGESARPGSEEYRNSEKYALRPRDFAAALNEGRSLEPYLTRLNEIRRAHPALQQLRDIHFHHTDSDQVIAWSKTDVKSGDTVLVVCTLDPHNVASANLALDMPVLGADWADTLVVHDEVSGATFHWGQFAFVRLEPWRAVAHVLRVDRPAA
jgi:starch synthase (maltosyl-transferring)